MSKDSKKIVFDTWGIATQLTAAHIGAHTGKAKLSVGESLDMLEEIHQQLLGMMELEPGSPSTPRRH
jgi:hypothetical protein